MAKIINFGRQSITLPTRHVVPRMGELLTTNDVLRAPDNEGVLAALTNSGVITIEFDPDPVEPEADTSILAAPAAPQLEDTPAQSPESPASGKPKKG